jgi:hypothetical protein
MLTRINTVVDHFRYVQWCPTYDHYRQHFEKEGPCNIARVEVVFEQGNRHKVNDKSENGADDHLVVYFVHF